MTFSQLFSRLVDGFNVVIDGMLFGWSYVKYALMTLPGMIVSAVTLVGTLAYVVFSVVTASLVGLVNALSDIDFSALPSATEGAISSNLHHSIIFCVVDITFLLSVFSVTVAYGLVVLVYSFFKSYVIF